MNKMKLSTKLLMAVVVGCLGTSINWARIFKLALRTLSTTGIEEQVATPAAAAEARTSIVCRPT